MNTVTINNVRIAYEQAGEGTPLVCVHGNFASRRWFKEQLDNPPEGVQVIAFDLPNFGASDAMPEAISIQAYATYLQAFIRNLNQPVLLAGHSLGGAVAQRVATSHPGLVKALILISSAPAKGFKTPEEQYPVLSSLKENPDMLTQALTSTMPTRTPAYFDDIVQDALNMQTQAFTGNARALETYDFRDSAKQTNLPVLVIRGEHDYIISEDMAKATASAYPNAQLELLEGVGHSPQIEMPERFTALVQAFLKGVTGV